MFVAGIDLALSNDSARDSVYALSRAKALQLAAKAGYTEYIYNGRRRSVPQTKYCCLGGGRTRCQKIGTGFAGEVWSPVGIRLSAWVRVEPPEGRAFSVYVPGQGQVDSLLQPDPPPWL